MINWNLYKASKYNHIISLESGNFLLFNSLRLSLIEIEGSKAKIISQWKDGMEFTTQNQQLDDESFKLLHDNFFIVERKNDESIFIENGQIQYKKTLSEKGEFHVLVNTTNNCNMHCTYCFEGDKKKNKLKSNTIESIISKIKSEFEDPKSLIKTLTLTWFGGEPLLNQKAIDHLSLELISLCNNYNIEYNGVMITNGTLLTPQFCQKMGDYKISFLQISIDGDEVTHNKSRPLNNNKNAYEIILNNISYIPDNIKIGIRIHATKKIIERIPYMLNDLEKKNIWPQHSKRITLNLAQIIGSDDNTNDKNFYLSNEEYFLAEYQFRLLCQYHYNNWAVRNNKPIANLKIDYPQLTFSLCGSAANPYSMAIDDMGFIHRCWENVNDENTRIQHIDDYDFNYKGYEPWKAYKKTNQKKCKSCKILPICNDGCIQHLMNDYGLRCTKWKYMLPFYIKNYYYSLKREEKKEIESENT